MTIQRLQKSSTGDGMNVTNTSTLLVSGRSLIPPRTTAKVLEKILKGTRSSSHDVCGDEPMRSNSTASTNALTALHFYAIFRIRKVL